MASILRSVLDRTIGIREAPIIHHDVGAIAQGGSIWLGGVPGMGTGLEV